MLFKVKFWFVTIEFVITLVTIICFWFPSPGIRDQSLWVLWLAVPFLVWRFSFQRDFLNPKALGLQFSFLIILTILNFNFAPYARQSYFVLVCRPLLGIWLFYNFCTWGTLRRGLMLLTVMTLAMSFVLIFFAMTGTQWIPDEKGQWIAFFSAFVPTITYSDTWLRGAYLSFNPNEISGAMSFLCPLFGACALHLKHDTEDKAFTIIKYASALASISLFGLIFLAQSRSAILGCLFGFTLVALSLKNNIALRRVVLAAVASTAIIVLGLFLNLGAIFSNRTQQSTGISDRDVSVNLSRIAIWNTAIEIIGDYPLTGNGMSMFRTATWVNPQYDIENFRQRGFPTPHAHNELLQVGTDFGVIGIVMYIGWFVSIGSLLWFVYQHGDNLQYSLAIGVAAGLLSHAIFGLFDAITLWDRFFFLQWWLFGLAGATYFASQGASKSTTDS